MPSLFVAARGSDSTRSVRSSTPLEVPGLNNIGLLIKTWGRVSWVDGDNDMFYLDDGSEYDDYQYPDAEADMPAGVKVVAPPEVTMPVPGSVVAVTGISSIVRVNDNYFRMIRLREWESI